MFLEFQALVLAVRNAPLYKEIEQVQTDEVVQNFTHHLNRFDRLLEQVDV